MKSSIAMIVSSVLLLASALLFVLGVRSLQDLLKPVVFDER